MAYTWYSVGVASDFSLTTNGQCINSAFAKNAPYYSINVYDNSSARAIKVLPETSTEIFASFNCIVTAWDNATTHMFSLYTADKATELFYICPNNSGGITTVYANGLSVGTFVMPFNSIFQFELHFIRSATSGVVQIWINGTKVVDYSGNTGAVTDLIGLAQWYGAFADVRFYISNIIFSNIGRVGSKVPVIVPLAGAGSANPPTYLNFFGNQTTSGSSGMSTGNTYVLHDSFLRAGTIKKIMLNLTVGGVIYLAICTRNGTNAYKHTRRVMSGPITIAGAGETVLTAGINFPADWVVAVGECLAIYTVTATLGSYVSSSRDSGEYTRGAYYYSGDALTAGAECTYAEYGSNNWPSLAAQVEVADTSLVYDIGTAITPIGAPNNFVEKTTYAEFKNLNDEMLCAVGGLPVSCSVVNSVKVCMRGAGGSSLTTADFELNIDGNTLAANTTLPTMAAAQSAQFDGTWTPAQFNNAQIGLKVKA